MARWFLSLAVVLMMSVAAEASLHEFVLGDPIPGENSLTVVGSNMFEIVDSPNMFGQYSAISPFVVEATSNNGPVQFELQNVTTRPDTVNLVFLNLDPASPGPRLFVQFDVAGTMLGGPVPNPVEDDIPDGVVRFNAPGLLNPNGSVLAGGIQATVTTVPEPSALAFGCLVIGMVGAGRVAKRRYFAAAE